MNADAVNDAAGSDDDVVAWLSGFRPPAPRPGLRDEVLAARPPRAWPWAEVAVLAALAASLGANVLASREAAANATPRRPTQLEREANDLARQERLDPVLGRRFVASLAPRRALAHR